MATEGKKLPGGTQSGIKGMDGSSPTVFFSYSRADQAKAIPIIQAIEQAGYHVWWDGMLEGGTDFLEETENALESAKAVVVLWSKTSVTSHWVRDEAMSGRVRERLVPLSLDGTHAPLGFRQVQLIDFQNWKENFSGGEMVELSKVLAIYHGADVAQARTPVKKKMTRRKLLVGSMLGGAGIALAATGLFRKVAPQGAGLTKNSIVVLPFENLLGDPSKDYISQGLSSELRTSLAQNESLRIVARSSSNAIAKEGLSVPQMARRLNVAYLLEGRVQPILDKLKVTIDFIDGSNGFNIWTKVFEFTQENLLSLQFKITQAVVQSLAAELSQTQPDKIEGGTENVVAFDEYLKGVEKLRANAGQNSLLQALEHLDRAVKLDMGFGNAHAFRAQVLLTLGITNSDATIANNYQNESVEAAKLAVSVSPNLASAQSTLGYVLFAAKLDMEGARAPYYKAKQTGYGDALVMARYATFMLANGHDDKALQAIRRAMELDPLNPTLQRTLGMVHYYGRRYNEAIEVLTALLKSNPDHATANALIGLSQIYTGQIETGLETCQSEPFALERLTCMAIGNFAAMNRSVAQQSFDELVGLYGDAGAYQQAQVYSQWGDHEKALKLLYKAVDLNDSGLTLLKIDPALEPLREHSEYHRLLAKMGFES